MFKYNTIQLKGFWLRVHLFGNNQETLFSFTLHCRNRLFAYNAIQYKLVTTFIQHCRKAYQRCHLQLTCVNVCLCKAIIFHHSRGSGFIRCNHLWVHLIIKILKTRPFVWRIYEFNERVTNDHLTTMRLNNAITAVWLPYNNATKKQCDYNNAITTVQLQ